MMLPSSMQVDYDVIIMGGALSGAAAGVLLKRAMPDLRVLIVERRDQFDKKVGESTSEVAGCFLSRVLHLSSYLSACHINKHGLRMWFYNKPGDSPNDCSEIGPAFQSRLPTYQIDRSLLDERILAEAVELGCELHRPATLRGIELKDNDEPHRVGITLPSGETRNATCRWLLDASGKAAVLAKQLGLHTPLGDEHPTSSVWCRFRNVNDLDSARTRREHPAFMMKVKGSRTTATNHLMGHGWWCWIIPLSDQTFSVGIVFDRTIYDLPEGVNLTERLKAHLLQHPIGRLMFENAEPVEDDTFYYKNLAYYSPQMCGNRWTLLGDAAGFIDPLYSQGIDYCGHTICATVAMLKKFFAGECIAAEREYLGTAYARSYRLWFEALYMGKYHYMGDAELMRVAFLLDLATYFIGPVRLVYTDPEYEWTRLPYDGPAGTAFARFMSFYNRRLKHLAQKRLEKGIYGAKNLHTPYVLMESFTASFRAFRFIRIGVLAWLKVELSTWWARPQKAMAKAQPVMQPVLTTES